MTKINKKPKPNAKTQTKHQTWASKQTFQLFTCLCAELFANSLLHFLFTEYGF